MSKTVPANIQTMLDGDVATLATCWMMILTNGTTVGYTDHDTDIVYDGLTYVSTSGFTPSAVQTAADLAVDNLEVVGVLNAINRVDLEAGVYDHAEVKIFLINYKTPADGIVKLRRGWLGEVTIKNGQFTAELRGLTQRLQQAKGSLYGPLCRAELGAAIGTAQWACGVNLATFTVTGTVTAVASRSQFTDSGRAEASGHFTYGLLTWTGGANNGLKMEVKSFAGGVFGLFQPMPYDIANGDTYSVYAGCDKIHTTCGTKFNNIKNFRGEPFIPGQNEMLKYGGQ